MRAKVIRATACKVEFLFQMNNSKPVVLCFSGGDKQHDNGEHDVYKDLAEIWPVERCARQHRLWTWIRFRGGAWKGTALMSSHAT